MEKDSNSPLFGSASPKTPNPSGFLWPPNLLAEQDKGKVREGNFGFGDKIFEPELTLFREV